MRIVDKRVKRHGLNSETKKIRGSGFKKMVRETEWTSLPIFLHICKESKKRSLLWKDSSATV